MNIHPFKKIHLVILTVIAVVSFTVLLQNDIEFTTHVRGSETLTRPLIETSNETNEATLLEASGTQTSKVSAIPTSETTTESTSENPTNATSPAPTLTAPPHYVAPVEDSINLANDELLLSHAGTIRNDRASSILPQKIYSVIGLESSGTQFVSGLIRDSLNIYGYREGSSSYANIVNENKDVQVQHFSLPWGSTCVLEPHVPIVDVVLPSQCSPRKHGMYSDCAKMTKDLWGFSSKEVRYPPRYNLDIVTHKEWYDAHGVEQYFIIVVREKTISHKARSKGHCTDPVLVEKEEEVGRDIIIDAINKYILKTNQTGKKVTRETYDFWHASTFQPIHGVGRKLAMSSLPNGNNVVLVSYETLMMLKEPYVKMLYEVLGIESNYMPSIKDGNLKYID